MKLKSFGCSFVFGSDLNDCQAEKGIPIFQKNIINNGYSLSTWPALLAKKFELDYECYAWPAMGNFYILERILSAIEEDETDIFVINWTWIDRFCYIKDEEKIWSPEGWVSILPSDDDKNSKFYYQNLHSQFRDKLESLICIKSAIDALTQKNQKFIMTYVDELLWEKNYHFNESIRLLQDSVDPYVSRFEGMSFFDWAKHKQFKISDRWHPLEEAHQAASKYMVPQVETCIKQLNI